MVFVALFILFAGYMENWTPEKFALAGAVIVVFILGIECVTAIRRHLKEKKRMPEKSEVFSLNGLTTD